MTEILVWPDPNTMDFSNTLLSASGTVVAPADDDTSDDYSEDEDDLKYVPSHPAVLSVRTNMSLQSPYPSRSISSSQPSSRPSYMSTVVTDPDMVNEQARRRMPFVEAAAAENGGDDNDDTEDAGLDTKRGRLVDEVLQGDGWNCTKCNTSNDGMESQCTNCDTRYVPKPGPVLGWAGSAVGSFSENKWKCDTCTSFNNNEMIACASCEVPRAGSSGGSGFGTGAAASTTTTTTAGAIGANGFSFGGAPPSSTVTNGTVSVGGFPSKAPAAAASTSSSAPVTRGGFSFGAAAPAAAAASTTANATKASSGFSFGAAAPAASGDSSLAPSPSGFTFPALLAPTDGAIVSFSSSSDDETADEVRPDKL
jgi:hypothetical protein